MSQKDVCFFGWRRVVVFGLIMIATGCATKSSAPLAMRETKLAELPDRHGLAGSYAGVSNGALIVAGGTNFPEKMPWEGGKKTWQDGVFVLPSPEGEWKSGFKLPKPLAYGAAVNVQGGVLCIGGGDGKTPTSDVFVIQWKNDAITFRKLADLPMALAGCSAAVLGDRVYVAGGSKGFDPAAQASERIFLSLDLSDPNAKWQTLDPWPGPERFYAVMASADDSIYVISGMTRSVDAAGKSKLHCQTDGYRYTPAKDGKSGTWKRIAELPAACAAAPTPAATVSGRWIAVVGGGVDDSDFAKPLEQRTGFRKIVIGYDTRADQWIEMGSVAESCVAVPLVQWGKRWVIPTGEIRAGTRSNRVYSYQW